jgi:hypothetical protein
VRFHAGIHRAIRTWQNRFVKDAKEDDSVTPKRSSWSAALAQLPGFPDKVPLPGVPARGAQAVSPLGRDADEAEEPGAPQQ